MTILQHPQNLSTNFFALGFTIAIFGTYFLILLWRYSRLKLNFLRITILDVRSALYLPLFALLAYISVNVPVVYVVMEFPIGLVEAYSLLNFVALLVESSGGPGEIHHALMYAFENRTPFNLCSLKCFESKQLLQLQQPLQQQSQQLQSQHIQQQSLVQVSTRKRKTTIWKSAEYADVTYNTLCRALRMMFLLRPVFLIINICCLMLGGKIGVAVGLVFHLLSTIILLRGMYLTASLYFAVHSQVKEMNGFWRLVLLYLAICGNVACRAAVYWNFRLGTFPVTGTDTHEKEIRLAVLLLVAFLLIAVPYLFVHCRGLQNFRLVKPINPHYENSFNSSSNNSNLNSSHSILSGYVNNDTTSSNGNGVITTTPLFHSKYCDLAASRDDLESSLSLTVSSFSTVKKKNAPPLDERFINVHPDAVYDFDFEAAPPLKPPVIPTIVPPLKLPVKDLPVYNPHNFNSNGRLNKYNYGNYPMKKFKPGAGIFVTRKIDSSNSSMTTNNNNQINKNNNNNVHFYLFLEKLFLLHDIFGILSCHQLR